MIVSSIVETKHVPVEKEYNKSEIAESVHMLWDPLIDEQRELFVENISILHFTHEDILYREGTAPQHLYYLLHGKVTMRREGIGGQMRIVRIVEPGSIFGYSAALEGCNHKLTATVSSDTLILCIPINLMFYFIMENSDFAMLFLKDLSVLLSHSVDKTISLTQKHVRGRLAETLLDMKHKYGITEDGHTLPIYFSREEIAQMSNMTTSNAIRTLSAFVQEGLISFEDRRIKYLDTEALQLISDRG